MRACAFNRNCQERQPSLRTCIWRSLFRRICWRPAVQHLIKFSTIIFANLDQIWWLDILRNLGHRLSILGCIRTPRKHTWEFVCIPSTYVPWMACIFRRINLFDFKHFHMCNGKKRFGSHHFRPHNAATNLLRALHKDRVHVVQPLNDLLQVILHSHFRKLAEIRPTEHTMGILTSVAPIQIHTNTSAKLLD